MKNPTIEKDEHGVRYKVWGHDNDFYNVGDLKKFLTENNIPDNAVIKVVYDGEYEFRPETLHYNKTANQFSLEED